MPAKYTPQDRIAAFWNKVSLPEYIGTDECWEWCGAIQSAGYGTAWVLNKSYKAHRLAFLLCCGSIPVGLYVCHRCDNKRCVNPSHLFLGTHVDNMNDMVRKGRAIGHPQEENGNHKLTHKDVADIRMRFENNECRQIDLAREYNVSRQCIFKIVRYKLWH